MAFNENVVENTTAVNESAKQNSNNTDTDKLLSKVLDAFKVKTEEQNKKIANLEKQLADLQVKKIEPETKQETEKTLSSEEKLLEVAKLLGLE